MNTAHAKGNVLDKIGIPSHMVWGYIGVVIFMVGDGLEQGWLSPFLVDHGLSMQQSATLFTMYGIAVTISAWLSGTFVQTWGPRKTMTVGLLAFILGSAAFIGWAIPHMHYPALLGSYALRGLGYPLFAYSFLVWVSYAPLIIFSEKPSAGFGLCLRAALTYSVRSIPAMRFRSLEKSIRFGALYCLWRQADSSPYFLTKINLHRYKNKISRNGKNCLRHLQLCLKTLKSASAEWSRRLMP